MQNYYGLIEMGFTLSAFLLFYVWQMRELNRDIAAREKREAEESRKVDAASDKGRP